MKNNKVVNCYFNCNYIRETRTANLRIIINSHEDIIYKNKRNFTKRNEGLAKDASLNKVFKVLNKLQSDNKIISGTNVNIFINNITMINQILYQDVRKSRQNRIEQLSKILKGNNNWQLKYHKDASKILNKLFRRKCNILKKENNKVTNIRKAKKQNVVRKVSEIKNNTTTNIIFFDMEMNCNSGGNNRASWWEAISIGAVKYNIYNKSVDKFYSLIKPKIDSILTNKCVEITNIKQEEIDNSRSFREVMQDFHKWLGSDRCIFVSWGAEDMKVLRNDNKRSGYRLQLINNMRKNYIDFQKEFSFYHLNSRQPISLVNALGSMGLEFEGEKHNAIDDALNLYRVYTNYILK